MTASAKTASRQSPDRKTVPGLNAKLPAGIGPERVPRPAFWTGDRIGWVLLAAVVLLGAFFLYRTWAVDLTALYFAGHFFETGRPDLVYLPGAEVFIADPPPEYVALGEAEGWSPGAVTPYLYPPLWAALLGPFTAKISAYHFFFAFQLMSLAALAAGIGLSYRIAGSPSRPGFTAWVLCSAALALGTGAGYFGLWLGQPQIIVDAVILAGFAALLRGWDIPAGAALAFAAALKLTPALLVLVFVMERRWKAAASFLAFGLGFTWVSIRLAGLPLHAELLDKLSGIDAALLVSRVVASLELAFLQAHDALAGSAVWRIDHPYMVPEPAWIAWGTRMVLAGGLIATWISTRALRQRPRIWVRLMAVLLITLVTGPLPWVHYLVLPLILLPGLVMFLSPERTLLALALIWAPLSLPAFLALGLHPGLGSVQAWLQLGAALAMLALVLVLARRGARPEAG